MMHHLKFAAGAAVLALSASACGGASPSARSGAATTAAPTTTSSTATSSTTTPPTTTPAPDPTADRATAASINLAAADLPGYTPTPSSNDGSDPIAAKLAQCAGAPDPSAIDVVDVSSPDFDNDTGEVSSDVTMVKTAADGAADLAAITSDKLGPCFQTVGLPALQATLPSGSTLSGLRVTPQAPPLGAQSFAFQVGLSVSVPGQAATTVVDDTEGFLVGRAEVSLDVFATGAQPDRALEARLLALLRSRATAAPGTA
ncbi:MAG TPA: hypothetical protein VFP61_13045 [Acidimicrobiales bacterium]|nr:hypothetical protein [Acidimicrobiales bacterium]